MLFVFLNVFLCFEAKFNIDPALREKHAMQAISEEKN